MRLGETEAPEGVRREDASGCGWGWVGKVVLMRRRKSISAAGGCGGKVRGRGRRANVAVGGVGGPGGVRGGEWLLVDGAPRS